MSNTAIFQTGGKQYRVKAGDFVKVERLDADGTVEFDQVLMLDDKIGTPFVDGARVVAQVVEQKRGDKVIGTGTKTWAGSEFGPCVLQTCNDSNKIVQGGTCIECGVDEHVESNKCVSNTRSCDATNASSAVQTWNEGAWGVCEPTACRTGYELQGNACVQSTGSGSGE